MPISTGHKKAQTSTMKAYQRPQQYIYHPCHVAPSGIISGHAVLVSVCLLMLPMLGLVDEHVHVQLTTTDHMSTINQWNVHSHHMTFRHTPLVLKLPSFDNVLPAMALQSRGVRSNIMCPSYTSHSGVPHASPVDLGRVVRVVRVMVALLLLLSGDIETNPGPFGEFLC